MSGDPESGEAGRHLLHRSPPVGHPVPGSPVRHHRDEEHVLLRFSQPDPVSLEPPCLDQVPPLAPKTPVPVPEPPRR